MPVHHTRGDTFSRAGQIALPEGSVGMSDMTGWGGRCQVRTQSGALVQELQFIWIDATQRLFLLTATAEQLTAAPTGTHVFDIQLTTPAGQKLSSAKDTFTVSGDVTP